MVTLHNGDCLPYLKAMPSKSVSAVISDPPYGIANTVGNGRYGRTVRKIENDYDLSVLVSVFQEMCRVAPLVMLFHSPRNLPDFYRQIDGVNFAGHIIWNKKAPGTGFGSIRYQHEHISVFGDLPKEKESIFSVIDEYRVANLHPHEKPVLLMQKLINWVDGENKIILDPFMGSGSTGVACVKLEVDFVGCELSQEYFSIAEKRIKEASLQQHLFTPSNNRLHHDGGDSAPQQALFSPEVLSPSPAASKPARRR